MTKRKTPIPSIVAEPPATYARLRPARVVRTSVQRPAKGTAAVYKRFNAAELLQEALKPMFKSHVRERLSGGQLDAVFLSKVFNISRSQLATRLAGAGTLQPAEAERVVLTEQLMAHGIAAFGERDVFMAWMQDESPALQGQRPIDLVRTTTGMALVLDELTSIEHGIPV